MIEPHGKSLKESVLPQQTVTSQIQCWCKSGRHGMRTGTNDLHLDVEKIGFVPSASNSAEWVTPSQPEIKSELAGKCRRENAIVGSRIDESITRK